MSIVPVKMIGILFCFTNMNDHKILLTKDGLAGLKKELEELLKLKRPAAVTRLANAKAQGDLSENSEYASAIDELSFIDGRIAELEEILKQATTVTISKKHDGKVDVGCKVRLSIDGHQETFTIVGEWEADPREKKISHSSPLGKALMGRKKGEKIEVTAPAGKIVYKILEIE